MDISPFQISIPENELLLLHQKLRLTRLPLHLSAADWTESSQNHISVDFIASIQKHWLNGYEWREEERKLNALLPQFTTRIPLDGFGSLKIHFVHSPLSGRTRPGIPLLFIHGWPGSFYEISNALPLLNEAGFSVVAPSLPGSGFSELPDKAGFQIAQHGEALGKLMLRLGYQTFVVQGGDWGSPISRAVASIFPKHVRGIHFNNLPLPNPKFTADHPEPITYTPFEDHQIKQYKNWLSKEFAYCEIQTARPLTLGIALNDSPIGLLTWITDKLLNWSDSTVRRRGAHDNSSTGYDWTPSEMITWTLLHYFAGCDMNIPESTTNQNTSGGPISALAIYASNPEAFMDTPLSLPSEQEEMSIHTPTGISAFKYESEMVPRSWAETVANVVFYREHEHGGHFAMYERPEEMVEDLIEFAALVWE